MKLRTQFTLGSFVILTFMGLLVLGTGWAFIHSDIRLQTEKLMQRDIDSYFRDFKEVEALLHSWGIRDSVFLERWQMENLNSMRFYRFYNTGHAIVISDDGEILSHHHNIAEHPDPPPEAVQAILENGEGAMRLRLNGATRFAVFRRFEPWGWNLGITVEESEIYKRQNMFLAEATVLIIGFVFITSIFASIFTQKLVDRIYAIKKCTDAIRRGDMDARISGDAASDELGELQQNINTMAYTLQIRTNEWLDAEEALRESEATYRSLVASSHDAIYLFYNHRFIVTNRRFKSIFGMAPNYEAMQHLAPPIHENGVLDSHDSSVKTSRFFVQDREGQELELEASLACVPHKDGFAVQGILRDITPRRRLEEQLRQSQKLEAIGTLAGGIAHDFNNILSVILGYCDYGKLEVENSPELTAIFDEIAQAGFRAKELVRQILTFSRKSKQAYSRFQLSMLLEETMTMLRSSLPSTVELVRETHSDASVYADATEMHQMVMNLVTNAFQAIPDGHGRIVVSLEDIARDDLSPDVQNQIDADRCVLLRVKDSGDGISPENLERIFDPFFTTREPGKGTGLGLAIIHGIVNRCKGVIQVTSKLGQGTTFSVYLPAYETEIETEKETTEHTLPTYSGHVLLVDDEQAITDLFSRALTKMGVTVTVFNDSTMALETFKTSPDQWDAVITDMTMPKVTGLRLAEEILALRPNLPVMLCTGYSEHVTEADIERVGIREILNKPMSPKEMAKKLNGYITEGSTKA